MYKASMTGSPGDSFRPWSARLGNVRRRSLGLGVYTPGEYVIPTTSDGIFQRMDYPFMDPSMSFKPGSQSVRNISAMPGTQPENAVLPGRGAPPHGVTGLGRVYPSRSLGLDLSSLTSSPLFLLAAAAGAYYFFVMRKG